MRLKRRRAGATALVLLAALLAAPSTPAAAATPVSLTGAHWVWYPEGSPASSAPAAYRYFRKTFTVAAGAVTEAQLVVTGDDTVDVWLNGKPVAASPRVADSWTQTPLYVDLQSALVGGTNTLAIAARNTTAGPAGMIGRVHVVTAGGTTDLVTDGSWKASQTCRRLGAARVQPTAAGRPRPTSAPTASARGTPIVVRPTRRAVAAGRRERHRRTPGQPARRGRGPAPLRLEAPAASTGGQQSSPGRLRAGRRTGDVWDSGRVPSGQQVDVVYSGPALQSHDALHLAGPGLGHPGPGQRVEPDPVLRDRPARTRRPSGPATSSGRPPSPPTWPGPPGSGTRRATPPPASPAGDPVLPPTFTLASAPADGDAGRHRRRHRRRVGQRHPGQHLAAGDRVVAAGDGRSTWRAGSSPAPTPSRSPAENTTQSPAGMIAKLTGRVRGRPTRRGRPPHRARGLGAARLQRQRLARRPRRGDLRHRSLGRQRRHRQGRAAAAQGLHGEQAGRLAPGC